MANPNYKYEDGIVSIKIDDKWIQPRFEQYENIEPIGAPGANGVVIKATHKITKRVDAIKIWLPRLRGDKNVISQKQYLAEVQKIAKLNDPRIATIHNAWNENGCYCCSMEYIDGITYEKWLERNRNINKRIEMLYSIFEVIVLYQSKGIIHGDIHAKNILIGRDNSVHIIDFGTSSLSSYEEQSVHRENYLMYDLVEKTLENEFDPKVFIYKKYRIDGSVKNDDDVRNAVSLFFSTSVLSYLHLVYLIHVDKEIINDPQVTYDYCRTIAKGDYLSLDYFYSKITGDNDRKLEMFSQVMFDAIEDELYENAQNDGNEADVMEYLSLFSYYEYVKSLIESNDIREDDITRIFGTKASSELVDVKRAFMETGDLFEFHKELLQAGYEPYEVQSMEGTLRVVLNKVIEENSGRYLLHIMRYIKQRILLLKQNDEECKKIVTLSYTYCLNNGFEYGC